MSRDPNGGTPFDPKTLHKYLYAGGDPINAEDPTGQDFVSDAFSRAWSAARATIEGTKLGESTLCVVRFIGDVANIVAIGVNYKNPFIGGSLGVAYTDLRTCLWLASLL